MTQVLIAALLFGARVAAQKPQLAQTPPMGWMSWEDFRCEVDCAKNPDACINERLYKQMADALQTDGYVAAGYKTISIDDCWESGTPGVLRRPGEPFGQAARSLNGQLLGSWSPGTSAARRRPHHLLRRRG